MRILAVGNVYPPPHLGGYEVVWQDTMHRARDEGHVVRVLTSTHAEADATEQDSDVHRELRMYWDWDTHEWTPLTIRGRLALERHNARALDRHLAEFAPDVVAWWSMGGLSLGLLEHVRRLGVPAVSVVHDDWMAYGPQVDAWQRLFNGRARPAAAVADRLTGLPTRVLPGRGSALVFNSRSTRKRAAAAGVDTTGADVITPGIDVRFQVAAPSREWRWRLQCVGRLDERKGLDTAIDAVGFLPAEATLDIVGSGDPAYTRLLRDRAAATGQQITFRGQIPRDLLPETYAEADVLLFPVRWDEPWGLVPLEAMGIGRPVVASGRGGSAEYLRDGVNALVVAPDDPEALAGAVRRLARDPALRARMHEAGRATAAAHSAADAERATLAAIHRAAV